MEEQAPGQPRGRRDTLRGWAELNLSGATQPPNLTPSAPWLAKVNLLAGS